jgi:3-hydroxymyristoyl/3-hydroxydecanoyl-(acyl carrier protein) dehydratase
MARASAEWTLDCPLGVREVSRAKFLRPIAPDVAVRLELKWTETNGIIHVQTWLSIGGQPTGEATLQLWRNAPN